MLTFCGDNCFFLVALLAEFRGRAMISSLKATG
jgi:hypothetical protein